MNLLYKFPNSNKSILLINMELIAFYFEIEKSTITKHYHSFVLCKLVIVEKFTDKLTVIFKNVLIFLNFYCIISK